RQRAFALANLERTQDPKLHAPSTKTGLDGSTASGLQPDLDRTSTGVADGGRKTNSTEGGAMSIGLPSTRDRSQVLALVAVAAIGAVLAGSARGAPTQFRLTFDGVQRPATFPSVGELQHEGAFSASAPFCASGYAADIKQVFRGPVSAIRRFACSD